MTDPLSPLRLPGGIIGAFRAALDGWWRELVVVTGLNVVWAMAVLTVVVGPPATAALFYVARRILEGDPFVGRSTFMDAARAVWRPAWLWALAVLLVGGVAAANLWLYRDAPGALWVALRWLWATILVVWVTINLFFWPLWFAQEESYRTLRATWRNALTFLSRHPLAALAVFVATLLLGTASVLTGVLLGTLFGAWASLLATAMLATHLPRE